MSPGKPITPRSFAAAPRAARSVGVARGGRRRRPGVLRVALAPEEENTPYRRTERGHPRHCSSETHVEPPARPVWARGILGGGLRDRGGDVAPALEST